MMASSIEENKPEKVFSLTYKLDVDNDDRNIYTYFIQDLRNLRKEVTEEVSHQPLKQKPSDWLYICLLCSNGSLTLTVDPRNLYVLTFDTYRKGYEGVSRLYERFGLGHQRDDFQGMITLRDLRNIPLGYFPLKQAISNLIVSSDEDLRAMKWIWMNTIIQMITEAARIELIAEHVHRYWWVPRPITVEMESIQTALIRGTFSSFMERLVTESSSKIKFARALANIDYVRLKDIGEGKYVREICGVVVVKTLYGHHAVYNQYPANRESKSSGEDISLICPEVPIYGNDPFTIHLRLQDDYDEFVKGVVEFDPLQTRMPYDSFDRHREEEMIGKHGSVSVGYTVLKDAYSATIEVVMINESMENLYGNIKASYMVANSGLSTRELFNKSSNEYVKVGGSQPSIPLIRPVFAVPVHYDFSITVDLWVWDDVQQTTQSFEQSNLHFTPIIGTQLMNLGKVQVSITCE